MIYNKSTPFKSVIFVENLFILIRIKSLWSFNVPGYHLIALTL